MPHWHCSPKDISTADLPNPMTVLEVLASLQVSRRTLPFMASEFYLKEDFHQDKHHPHQGEQKGLALGSSDRTVGA